MLRFHRVSSRLRLPAKIVSWLAGLGWMVKGINGILGYIQTAEWIQDGKGHWWQQAMAFLGSLHMTGFWISSWPPAILTAISAAAIVWSFRSQERKDGVNRVRSLPTVGGHPVQLELFYVQLHMAEQAIYVEAAAQFHNGSSQPLTVRKLRASIVDQTHSEDAPITTDNESETWTRDSWLPNSGKRLTCGVLIAAGVSSPRYFWNFRLPLPSAIKLQPNHLLRLTLVAMNQADVSIDLPINWTDIRASKFVKIGQIPSLAQGRPHEGGRILPETEASPENARIELLPGRKVRPYSLGGLDYWGINFRNVGNVPALKVAAHIVIKRPDGSVIDYRTGPVVYGMWLTDDATGNAYAIPPPLLSRTVDLEANQLPAMLVLFLFNKRDRSIQLVTSPKPMPQIYNLISPLPIVIEITLKAGAISSGPWRLRLESNERGEMLLVSL